MLAFDWLQPVNVQVDTGSSDFAVYTTTTTTVPAGTTVYNYLGSSSGSSVNCPGPLRYRYLHSLVFVL